MTVLSVTAYNGLLEMRARSLPVAVVGCSVALAACGSAGKPIGTAGSAADASFLRFSECMRAHGVQDFPDPGSNGRGLKIAIGSGLNPEAPAFQQAQQSCRKLLPGGGPPRVVPESVKVALVTHAQCMRNHGVSNYPDPTFPPGGGVANFIPSTVDANSPAFQSAAQACGGG